MYIPIWNPTVKELSFSSAFVEPFQNALYAHHCLVAVMEHKLALLAQLSPDVASFGISLNIVFVNLVTESYINKSEARQPILKLLGENNKTGLFQWILNNYHLLTG